MCSARNRSRSGSDKAKISTSSTWTAPADGRDTPAITLSSVVLPEPLRPRRTVQLAEGRARCSTSSTSRSMPPSIGNDFLTPRTMTAGRALFEVSAVAGRIWPRGSPLYDGDRIDRDADPALEQQRAEDKEELVGPVLGQRVEVEDLHNVGAPVPDEVDVQGKAEEAECLSLVIRVHRKAPLHRRI